MVSIKPRGQATLPNLPFTYSDGFLRNSLQLIFQTSTDFPQLLER